MARLPDLLKRLAAIDPASADVDRVAVEKAVASHFKLLELPVPQMRWAVDGPSAFHEIFLAARLRERRMTAQERMQEPLIDRMGKAVEGTRDPAYAEKVVPLIPKWRYDEPMKEFDDMNALADWRAAWMAAFDAASRLFREAGLVEGSEAHFQSAHSTASVGSSMQPNPAELARGYLVDPKKRNAWAPMIDALEAGLWLFWPTPGETLLVPRPARKFVGQQLHDERGPAVSWPGGASYWALHDERVERDVVESPTTIDPVRIEQARKPWLRATLMERYGRERYFSEVQAAVVGETPGRRLIQVRPPGRDPFAYVEITRAPSPRPTEYVRVPATVKTPEEGLAWTFGVLPEEIPTGQNHWHDYASGEIGPVAREIIDRLRRVDRSRSGIDLAGAEAALGRIFPGVVRGTIKVRCLESHGPLSREERCFAPHLADQEGPWPEPDDAHTASFSAVAVGRLHQERDALGANGADPDIEVLLQCTKAAGIAQNMHQGAIDVDEGWFRSRWMSWVDVYEAGVAALWMSGDLLAYPRPAMRFKDGKLHDDGGPAVSWEGGPELHFRNGEPLDELRSDGS